MQIILRKSEEAVCKSVSTVEMMDAPMNVS